MRIHPDVELGNGLTYRLMRTVATQVFEALIGFYDKAIRQPGNHNPVRACVKYPSEAVRGSASLLQAKPTYDSRR